MARITKGFLFNHISGKLGDYVFRQYAGRTVVSKVPDMSQVKPTKLQKANRKKFIAAVAYAKKIHRNPKLHALYKPKLKRGQSVFQYALKEFFKNV